MEPDAAIDLRPDEVICPCHNLAHNRALAACPITAAEALPKWSVQR